jgi:hypothetical protein
LSTLPPRSHIIQVLIVGFILFSKLTLYSAPVATITKRQIQATTCKDKKLKSKMSVSANKAMRAATAVALVAAGQPETSVEGLKMDWFKRHIGWGPNADIADENNGNNAMRGAADIVQPPQEQIQKIRPTTIVFRNGEEYRYPDQEEPAVPSKNALKNLKKKQQKARKGQREAHLEQQEDEEKFLEKVQGRKIAQNKKKNDANLFDTRNYGTIDNGLSVSGGDADGYKITTAGAPKKQKSSEAPKKQKSSDIVEKGNPPVQTQPPQTRQTSRDSRPRKKRQQQAEYKPREWGHAELQRWRDPEKAETFEQKKQFEQMAQRGQMAQRARQMGLNIGLNGPQRATRSNASNQVQNFRKMRTGNQIKNHNDHTEVTERQRRQKLPEGLPQVQEEVESSAGAAPGEIKSHEDMDDFDALFENQLNVTDESEEVVQPAAPAQRPNTEDYSELVNGPQRQAELNAVLETVNLLMANLTGKLRLAAFYESQKKRIRNYLEKASLPYYPDRHRRNLNRPSKEQSAKLINQLKTMAAQLSQGFIPEAKDIETFIDVLHELGLEPGEVGTAASLLLNMETNRRMDEEAKEEEREKARLEKEALEKERRTAQNIKNRLYAESKRKKLSNEVAQFSKMCDNIALEPTGQDMCKRLRRNSPGKLKVSLRRQQSTVQQSDQEMMGTEDQENQASPGSNHTYVTGNNDFNQGDESDDNRYAAENAIPLVDHSEGIVDQSEEIVDQSEGNAFFI